MAVTERMLLSNCHYNRGNKIGPESQLPHCKIHLCLQNYCGAVPSGWLRQQVNEYTQETQDPPRQPWFQNFPLKALSSFEH